MRILVCGGREFNNVGQIRAFMAHVPAGTTIIHGGAGGADTLAGEAADELGLPVIVFPAQWDRYGKRAGFIRNQQMLDEGKPDLVIFFHENLAESKGTLDMTDRALRAGLLVIGNPWGRLA